MHEITLENIKKIQRHIYFDKTIANNKVINRKLRSRIMILMFHAMLNKSKETLLLSNNRTFKYSISRNGSDYNNVRLSDEMINLLTNSDNEMYTAIHNHPNNSNFSLADLKQLVSYFCKKKLMVYIEKENG